MAKQKNKRFLKKRQNNKKKRNGKNKNNNISYDTTSLNNSTEPETEELRKVKPSNEFLCLVDDNLPQEPHGLMYKNYKNPTNGFVDGLLRLIPDRLKGDESVQVLIDGAKYLKQQGKKLVPWKLMSDLKCAIRGRKKMKSTYYPQDDMNDSHGYYIKTLYYCYAMLRPLQEPKKERNIEETIEHDENTCYNRYSALYEEDDDESDMPDLSIPLEHFIIPEEKKKFLTLEGLIKGNKAFRVKVLLLTIDELLRQTESFSQNLKASWKSHIRAGHPRDTIVNYVLQNAILTNQSMEEIYRLEHELAVDYPELGNIYSQIALFEFAPFIEELHNNVVELSPKGKTFAEADAIEFFSELLKQFYLRPVAYFQNTPEVMRLFCNKWNVTPSIFFSKNRNSTYDQYIHTFCSSDMLFKSLRYVSQRKNSLSPTLCALQGMAVVIKDDFVIRPKEGHFGPKWVENSGSARSVHNLSDFLLSDVLSVLIPMCQHSFFSTMLPRENELLEFFVRLKSFVDNPKQNMTWSLLFGTHSICISALSVQGGSDFHDIAKASRESFEIFCDQIDKLLEEESKGERKIWNKNLNWLSQIRNMSKPVLKETPNTRELRAFWNPVIGGMLLLYVTVFVNIECCAPMIDLCAQLRIVLHLYNALLKRKVIVKGEIPLLDWLQQVFCNNKAVWEGEVPHKGFVSRWWLTWGCTIMQAKKLTEDARCFKDNGAFTNAANMKREAKKMKRIEAKDFCKLFRRLCLHDYSEVNYVSPTNEEDIGAFGYLEDLTIRINDTMDVVEDEAMLLSSNMHCFAYKMNDFVWKLSDLLGWTELIDRVLINLTPEQRKARLANYKKPTKWQASDDNWRTQVFVHIFTNKLLSCLDFGTDEEVRTNQEVVAAKMLLKAYFNSLTKEDFKFYTGTQ